MPLYDFECGACGQVKEVFVQGEYQPPVCCGGVMTRLYSVHGMRVKMGDTLWLKRMDYIHEAQADRGERLRFVHPKEIQATT